MAVVATPTSRALSHLFLSSSSYSLLIPILKPRFCFPAPSLRRPFSSASPYPLYYELIHHRPARPLPHPAASKEVGGAPDDDPEPMDRSKRKYYRKRQKRMYGGSDSDDSDRRSVADDYVELQPEIVDFPRLHAREEELYFYDAFAFPWEKEKHYRMVYQLEKKYFPDHCLEKAFVNPGAELVKAPAVAEEGKTKKGKREGKKDGGEERDERALLFFDEGKDKAAAADRSVAAAADRNVSEKKVEEFFKCLKKVPSASGCSAASNPEDEGEPYLVSRKTQLPPRWDRPSGTVVLVDKPKGWTSFTVCGKLRRLVNVQKVGHAGTLDPMATGLLIVCIGKATKLVERYQGMVKGYSGVFRMGEATSTWDADSPVIQRELWEHIKDEDIKKTAASFCGEIWQVPPMFSAIKVGGEKMYEKARRGEIIELSPRRISIFQFDIERSLEDRWRQAKPAKWAQSAQSQLAGDAAQHVDPYKGEGRVCLACRQNLIFRVTCSKGTYIRSLCADLGKALGSCAHLTSLRRDSIGEFSADDAWNFLELEELITRGYF